MIRQPFLAQPLFLLGLLLCGFAAKAQAQPNALSVSPASVEAKVRRGATYTQAYTLSNSTGERLRLRCSVIDYWYDKENKRVTGRPGTLPRSASPWVQFSSSELTLEPHSSATVTAVITVPFAAAGGYYTMPVFEATPVKRAARSSPSGESTAVASIGIRFRGLVMLVTEDASEYNIEIMGGRVLPPTASTPLELDIDVRNRGTVHARLRGDFALLDAKGKLSGRGKVENGRFLPGQRNILRVPWAGELAPGHYTAVVTLSYERAGMDAATIVYELPFEVRASSVAQGR